MGLSNERSKLKISARLLHDELVRLGSSMDIIDGARSLMEYTDDSGASHLLIGTCSDKSSSTGFMIARDKSRTAVFAEKLNIPIPDATLCSALDEAEVFMAQHDTIVVKPLNNMGGVGVSTGIHTKTALKRAFSYAHIHSTKIIAQRHLSGDDVRLLVIGGSFVSAVMRQPAEVTGDGRLTAKELIALENTKQNRNDTAISSLMHIDMDAAKRFLSAHIDDVVPKDETIQVVGPANISLGGSLHEVSHLVTEEMKSDAVKITEKLALGICGVDMIWDRQAASYGLIEVNAVPGIDIHDDPFSKTSSDAVAKYAQWLFAT